MAAGAGPAMPSARWGRARVRLGRAGAAAPEPPRRHASRTVSWRCSSFTWREKNNAPVTAVWTRELPQPQQPLAVPLPWELWGFIPNEVFHMVTFRILMGDEDTFV